MARNGCYLSDYASFGQDETHQAESGNGCKKRTLKIQTVSSEFDETVFFMLIHPKNRTEKCCEISNLEF